MDEIQLDSLEIQWDDPGAMMKIVAPGCLDPHESCWLGFVSLFMDEKNINPLGFFVLDHHFSWFKMGDGVKIIDNHHIAEGSNI